MESVLESMNKDRGDTRSLPQLAREALTVQDACNLSGVVHTWSRSVSRLRELMPQAGTEQINRHCINVMFADKCRSLTNPADSIGVFGTAYSECQKLAEGVAIRE